MSLGTQTIFRKGYFNVIKSLTIHNWINAPSAAVEQWIWELNTGFIFSCPLSIRNHSIWSLKGHWRVSTTWCHSHTFSQCRFSALLSAGFHNRNVVGAEKSHVLGSLGHRSSLIVSTDLQTNYPKAVIPGPGIFWTPPCSHLGKTYANLACRCVGNVKGCRRQLRPSCKAGP